MNGEVYDVVVVGGGIHGAGVAQAATAAGYSALLMEKEAPAAGTSSRSSKLIHGGLRYLESAQFGLVRESLYERDTLLRNAPGLVRLVPFLIPVYRHTQRRAWQIRLGLSVYRLLGGLRRSGRFRTLRRSEWESLGGLAQDGLERVFCYYDAHTDDVALTEAVIACAKSLGAAIAFPARFIGAERQGDGYQVNYQAGSDARSCRCTVLVNAGGPWVNHVQNGITPRPPLFDIELVQGTHIQFNEPISDSIFYVEAPRDGRAVFVMPWNAGTLVGTTETPYRGEPEAVEPLPAEIEYLEETLRAYFPAYRGSRIASWAGLRVLPGGPAKPFHRPRETTLITDDPLEPQAIAIYGGKLTAYRATAARVMKLAQQSLPHRVPIARTDRLPLRRPSE
jgi:glycerol-3-phosphate dehydrogenase